MTILITVLIIVVIMFIIILAFRHKPIEEKGKPPEKLNDLPRIICDKVDELRNNEEERTQLVKEFDKAMREIYWSALKECNYKASIFLKMVNDVGGLQTAKILLRKQGFQYGFEKLWGCGCLHITMEALILKEPWQKLFTEEEKEIARKRLRASGYKF